MTDPRVKAIREALDSLDEAAHGWPDDNKYMRAHAAAEPALASLEGQLSFSARVAHQAVQRLGSEATGAQPTGGTTRADFAPSGTTDASQPQNPGGSQSEPGKSRVGVIPECPRCHGTLRIPVVGFADREPRGTGPCPDCYHRLSLCGIVTYSSWHEPVACAFFPDHEGDHSWASIPALPPAAEARVQELERERDEARLPSVDEVQTIFRLAKQTERAVAAEARLEETRAALQRLDVGLDSDTRMGMSVITERAPLDAVSIILARRAASDGTGRRVRELAGLSLDEMARFVHVSPQTILRWELNRRTARAEAAQRYAEGLRLLIATLSDVERDDAIVDLQRSLAEASS